MKQEAQEAAEYFGASHRVHLVLGLLLFDFFLIVLFRDYATWVRVPISMAFIVLTFWIISIFTTVFYWPTEIYMNSNSITLSGLGRSNTTIAFGSISGYSSARFKSSPLGSSEGVILYLNDGSHRCLTDCNFGEMSTRRVGQILANQGVLLLGTEGPYRALPRVHFRFDR